MTGTGSVVKSELSQDPTMSGHFKDCALMDTRRTEPAKQLPTADLVDLSEHDTSALPCDDTGVDQKHGQASFVEFTNLLDQTPRNNLR